MFVSPFVGFVLFMEKMGNCISQLGVRIFASSSQRMVKEVETRLKESVVGDCTVLESKNGKEKDVIACGVDQVHDQISGEFLEEEVEWVEDGEDEAAESDRLP